LSSANGFAVVFDMSATLSAIASMLSAIISALFSVAEASGDFEQAATDIRPAAAATSRIFFIRMLPSITKIAADPNAVAKRPNTLVVQGVNK